MTEFERKMQGAARIEAAVGSKFGAVMYIAQEARKRAEANDHYVLDSEAVCWVITGDVPESAKKFQSGYYESRSKRSPIDRINYIEDRQVREAVKGTITKSLKKLHLIYTYKGIQDEYRKSRVRVISNMIWDEITREQVDNKFFH